MIEETGRVVAVENGSVWVETLRRSTCSACSARQGCGQHVLMQLGGESRHIQAISNQPLQIDDQVIIGIPEDVVVKGALLVYSLPLLGLLAGVMIAQWLTGQDFWTMLAGVLGLCLGFVVIVLRSHSQRHNPKLQPVVLGKAPGKPIAPHEIGVTNHC
jgi:sigma-E factor negative regulatory protein RseC